MFVARQFFLILHTFKCKIFRPQNAWVTNIKYGCLLYSFLSFINDINFDVPMTVYSHLIAYQVYQTPATLMGESRDYQKQISTISIKKSKPNWYERFKVILHTFFVVHKKHNFTRSLKRKSTRNLKICWRNLWNCQLHFVKGLKGTEKVGSQGKVISVNVPFSGQGHQGQWSLLE